MAPQAAPVPTSVEDEDAVGAGAARCGDGGVYAVGDLFVSRCTDDRDGFVKRVMMGVAAMALMAPAQRITPLSPDMRAAMTGRSWRVGCPVTLDDLAAVPVKYFDFDGRTEEGTLVVHRRVAEDVARIFAGLYKARFPIREISQWEKYGPGKYAEQDVTVGFYCEKADDAPGEWSSHAYGVAINLNPLENPFRQETSRGGRRGRRSWRVATKGRGRSRRTGSRCEFLRTMAGAGAALTRARRII
jgi:hypothetical protein